jgi:hypothetical protein
LADANGHYSVLLGAATAAGMPAELFGTGQSRWLGVTVARHEEMPRVMLASVPYALKAADAETLGGLPASAYVTNESLAAKITPGSTTILTTPQGAATTAAENAVQPAAGAAAANTATTNAALPTATPTGSGTTNYIPKWTSSSALGNSVMFQSGSNIGIGTSTPAETLDVNGNSIFRGSFQLPPGHDATASAGYESHSFQFQASSYNSSTKASTTQSFGFRAEPLNNNTANPSSQLELFFIPNGGSDFEYTGVSWSSTGIQTFAPGQTFSGVSETLTGSLFLPSSTTSGGIYLGGTPFLANYGGFGNVFVGPNSGGTLVTSGSVNNAALGNGALGELTSGTYNVAAGVAALGNTSTGSFNTAIGSATLLGNQSGNGLTALGYQAGLLSAGGAQDTYVGYEAQHSDEGSYTNATAIGAFSQVSQNNSLVLGSIAGVNGGTVSAHVGIGTTTPTYPLQVIDDGLNGYAIQGVSNTPNHSAVDGFSTATTGDSNGGYFYSSSPNGSGVVGVNNTATGYAAYFVGNVFVAGNLGKSSGSFKIDDPADPAGKYLSHSFVESPDMMNIYNGNVVTNAKGYAVVTMPSWFEALNADFRYQLTPVGQFAQAMVASEIKNGKFTIRSSKPHVKISWQVTGIRHDAYANAHRIPTEEEKPANEQGHYLHPELFGAGPEQGIGAAAMAANVPASAAHKDQ